MTVRSETVEQTEEPPKKSDSSTAITPEERARILAALGVGKQSPQYKRVKAVLDQIA